MIGDLFKLAMKRRLSNYSYEFKNAVAIKWLKNTFSTLPKIRKEALYITNSEEAYIMLEVYPNI